MLNGVNYQTGTTYTFGAADVLRVTQFSNASPVAVTLPNGSTLGFQAGAVIAARNNGAGTVTITCSGCTINGAATLALSTGGNVDLYSDGINYVGNLTGNGSSSPGGANTQLQINNSGVFGAISNVAAGSVLASNGASALPIFQAKPVIDVRDVSGIDCTGATDSSSALNTLFGSITNRKIIIPQTCQLQIQTQLTIFGQSQFEIEGQGFQPTSTGASPLIFGCSGSAGPLLYINKSQHWHIQGIVFASKGNSCSSSFTQGVSIDQSGAGGLTQLDGRIDYSGFTSNLGGTAISNYAGIVIVGTSSNTEGMRFFHNWIQCQNSTSSAGIWLQSTALASDIDVAEGNNIANCYYGIRHDTGNMRIINNEFGNVGNNSVFGAHGAAIFITNCVSGLILITGNQHDSGGPFLNVNNDASGGCTAGITMIGNSLGVADSAATDYPVNMGTTGAPYVLIGNTFNITQTGITVAAIGSSSQTSCSHGPLGTLIDIGNKNVTPANTARWSGCSTHDFQQGHTQINSYSDGTSATNGSALHIGGEVSGGQGTYTGPSPQMVLGGPASGFNGQLNLAGASSGSCNQSSNSSGATITDSCGRSGTTLSESGQITSTLASGTAPFSITSTTPVANLTTVPTTYNHSGTQQTAAHIVEDSCTLGTSCSVTLTGSAVFTSSSSYQCTAADQTAANAVKFAPSSGSAFSLTGTGTDLLSYICIGN